MKGTKEQNFKKMQKRITKNTKGITLIALMVTIIILLILAGISIAMLTGNNGILSQAGDAKEETRGASVKEARDLWKINQEADNQTESATAQTLEELLNDLENQKLITAEERATIEETGKVTIGSRTIAFKTILAKDVLKTDSTATEAADKSSYVKYNGLDCRVLYNDETHGLQIITAGNVEEVTLGSGDTMDTATGFSYGGDGADASESVAIDENFRTAAASYNNAVNNLNNKAKSYKDTKGIAKDARCLGSTSTLKNGKFEGDTSGMCAEIDGYVANYGWNNKFKTEDTNYLEDVDQLNTLGLNVSSEKETWLASRSVDSDVTTPWFHLRIVGSNGGVYDRGLCYIGWSSSTTMSYAQCYGFRPVFLLSSNVVISSGDGTIGNPYNIE